MRYRSLWTIEECFRIQMDELAMRPIFHWKPERIQVHILLCYMAFTLIRHAEWRVRVQQRGISIGDIRRELQRVQVSILEDSINGHWMA